MFLDFGENAQAITMTPQEQKARFSGTPSIALEPVGNTISDVIKAGNVATIIAKSSAPAPPTEEEKFKTTMLNLATQPQGFTPMQTLDMKMPIMNTQPVKKSTAPTRTTSRRTTPATPNHQPPKYKLVTSSSPAPLNVPYKPVKTTAPAPPPAPKPAPTKNYFTRFTPKYSFF